MTIRLKELIVVMEMPPSARSCGNNGSNRTSISHTHQPRLQVSVTNVVAETPHEWRYARTSLCVQRALEYLQSSYKESKGGGSGNAHEEHYQQQQQQYRGHNQPYTHEHALQDLEDCLIYGHVDLSVAGLQLQYSSSEQQASSTHHQQQQQQQKGGHNCPTTSLLPSLMPPLHVSARLATNRISQDTQLPVIRAGVEVGGWEGATLTASQITHLQNVINALQQLQPASSSPPRAPSAPSAPQPPPSESSEAASVSASSPLSAVAHPAAGWGLPPLKHTTQLHLRLLPISVAYTEDTLEHTRNEARSLNPTKASAVTVQLGGAEVNATLCGQDAEVWKCCSGLCMAVNTCTCAECRVPCCIMWVQLLSQISLHVCACHAYHSNAPVVPAIP